MWVEREIEAALKRAIRSRPVVIVTGARQSGKTSLLRHAFAEYNYVSLDLPSEAEFAEKDPDGFLAKYSAPLIIDEIQYAPKIFRHLKTRVDQQRTLSGQFLLTGSQKFTLMKEVSDSLAGRAEIVELEPLSFFEIQEALPETVLLDFILRGGYPELYEQREIGAHQFYRSYVSTYLERDVRALLQVTALRDFERFLRVCALRSGQLLNKAELARDVGISPSTANEWLSVLAASNQVILLEPWFRNRTKSIVKSPKLYLSDSGLLCYLLNIQTTDELLRSPYIGSIWETTVFAELRRRQLAKTLGWTMFFWRDRSREVDFLNSRGGRFDLFEAKWTEIPDKSDAANLFYLRHELGEKNIEATAIYCRTRKDFPIAENLWARSISSLA